MFKYDSQIITFCQDVLVQLCYQQRTINRKPAAGTKQPRLLDQIERRELQKEKDTTESLFWPYIWHPVQVTGFQFKFELDLQFQQIKILFLEAQVIVCGGPGILMQSTNIMKHIFLPATEADLCSPVR